MWKTGVPSVARWLTNPTRNHEVAGSVPAPASGLTIRRCRELWCRLQTRLRSRVAVVLAQAGGYSSDWTPSLGTSICCGSGPRNSKKTKKKKKKKMWKKNIPIFIKKYKKANKIYIKEIKGTDYFKTNHAKTLDHLIIISNIQTIKNLSLLNFMKTSYI